MAATFIFLAQENSLALLSLQEEELVVGATQFCGWVAGMVGNSLNAVVVTRIQAVVGLYRCLPNAEPGFYENPMNLQAGDTARFMEMGAVTGNVVIVTACFLLHFLADAFMQKPMFIPLPRLLARCGWVLYILLTQPTIAFCCRLWKAGEGSNVAAATIIFLYWLFLLVLAFVIVYRVRIRWLPFGAGAPTEELIKIYPELMLLKPDEETPASPLPLPHVGNIGGTGAARSAQDHAEGGSDKGTNLLGDQELADARPSAAPASVAENDGDDDAATADAARRQPQDGKSGAASALGGKLGGGAAGALLAGKKKLGGVGGAAHWAKLRATTRAAAAFRGLGSTQAVREFVEGSSHFTVGYQSERMLDADGRRVERTKKRVAKSKEDKVFVNRPLLPGERRAGKWLEIYEGSKDKLRYGTLFMGLRPGFSFFLLFQMSMSWIYGILQGAKDTTAPNKCEKEAWALTIFLIFEAVAYAAVQPSRFFHDNLFFDFVTAGNMAAGAMLASRRTSGYSELLVYVAVMVVAGIMIIKMFLDIWGRVSAKMNKDKLLNEEADLQARQGEVGKGDAVRAILEKQKAIERQEGSKGNNATSAANNGAAPAASSSSGGNEAAALGATSDGNGGGGLGSAPAPDAGGPGGLDFSGGSRRQQEEHQQQLSFGASEMRPRNAFRVTDDYSPLRAMTEEDVERRTQSALLRLQGSGSRIFIRDDDNDNDDGSASRRNGGSKGAATAAAASVRQFLSLSPEDGSMSPVNGGSPGPSPHHPRSAAAAAAAASESAYRPVRIGANGLVEGLTLLDTAPALPLRLSPGNGNVGIFAGPSPNSSPARAAGDAATRRIDGNDDDHHLSRLRASRDEPVRNLNPLDNDSGAALENEFGLGDADGMSPRSRQHHQRALNDVQHALDSNRALGGDGNRGADLAARHGGAAKPALVPSSYSLTSSLRGAFAVPPLPLLSSITAAESGTNSNKNIFSKLQLHQQGNAAVVAATASEPLHSDPEAPIAPPPFSGNGGAQAASTARPTHSFNPFGASKGRGGAVAASNAPSVAADALGPLRASSTSNSDFAAAVKHTSANANGNGAAQPRPLFSGFFAPRDQDVSPTPQKQKQVSYPFQQEDSDAAKKPQLPTAADVRPLLAQFSLAHLNHSNTTAAASAHPSASVAALSKVLPSLPLPERSSGAKPLSAEEQEEDYDLPPVRQNPAARPPRPDFARVVEL